jgi:Domain of unknown function (DUF4126)
MPGLDTLINLLGLPIASGINLYATILVLGLGQRFGWLQGLPDELHILANPIVLGVAGALYTIEFFADKIPYLDTLWDGLHTFIRPVGAAYLALQAAAGYGPEAKLLAMFVGGALGLGAHATKAGTRLLVNTSPEPLSNSVVSVAEDFGVVALLALMYSHPGVALGVVLVLIGLMAVITPLLFRMIRFLLAGVGGALAGALGSREQSLSLAPDWLATKFPGSASAAQPRVYPCHARRVPGAPSFQTGYLVVLPEGLHFAFRTLFRSGFVPLAEGLEPACSFQRRILFDVIAVDGGRNAALICVAKNWSPAVRAEIGVAAPSPDWQTAQDR